MPRLAVLVACLAAAAPMTRPAAATEYGTPSCPATRNSLLGAPFPAEPNREDTRAAQSHAPSAKIPAFAFSPNFLAMGVASMQKIDRDGTDALTTLPPATPRIDDVIDRHLINLIWARKTLALAYEDGRSTGRDVGEAARLLQASLDTHFIDDRGCDHRFAPDHDTLFLLAGHYAYGLGVAEDRDKARTLAVQAGSKGANVVFLIDHDALPKTYGGYDGYCCSDLAARVEAIEHPADDDSEVAESMRFAVAVVLWGGLMALLVGALALILHLRRHRASGEPLSFYRAVFAAYDAVHGIVARLGLIATGLVAIGTGFWMLALAWSLGAFQVLINGPFDLGGLANISVLIGAVGGILGGLAKLAEAARLSAAPGNTRVHGSARPAAEPEAKAAARGEAVTGDLHERTFKE